MLDDPMFTAELIAAKREAEDKAWREKHGGFVTPLSIDRASFGLPPLEDADIDAAWRAQYQDLKAREAWHKARSRGSDFTAAPRHHVHFAFADCPQPICRGDAPVPR